MYRTLFLSNTARNCSNLKMVEGSLFSGSSYFKKFALDNHTHKPIAHELVSVYYPAGEFFSGKKNGVAS